MKNINGTGNGCDDYDYGDGHTDEAGGYGDGTGDGSSNISGIGCGDGYGSIYGHGYGFGYGYGNGYHGNGGKKSEDEHPEIVQTFISDDPLALACQFMCMFSRGV